jgi:methionyl-tRNA formyltransferase
VFWALRNDEPKCGLTIHEMSSGIDTGDIIFQVQVPTRDNDSVSSLYERIISASVPLVPKLVGAVARKEVPRIPQTSEGASYFGATREEDFRISWSMKAARITRWVNATPGQCFAEVGGQRLFFVDIRLTDRPESCPVGTLLDLQPQCCRIAATDGSIEIRRLRSAEGKETDAGDAFERLGLQEGAILGGE